MNNFQRPRTLTEATVSHLTEEIILGDLSPGTAISEASLATRLQVSRGTVREALRELAASGLVESAPHQVSVVSDMSPERAREIFTLRALLESYAARLTVERAKEAAIGPLEQALRAFQEASTSNSPLALVEADMHFHEVLSTHCGHELLLTELQRIRTHTRRFLVNVRLYHVARESAFASHEPLVKALRAGNPERMEAVVRDHVLRNGEALLQRMQERRSSAQQVAARDIL